MTNYLLITESPTKAKKIQSFLPKEYLVKSSCGHIRDLEKKKTKRYGNPDDFGIDVEKNFKPKYVVLSDKKDIVNQLKGYSKNRTVIFAADDDREGEAIAWHTSKVLKSKLSDSNRIIFREITKKAITESLKHPKKINMNEVNSQQARRIIDRLIGFRLSPCLWKHIQTDVFGLSAGRVQSSLLNLLKEREDYIQSFEPEISLSISGVFIKLGKSEYIITDENEEDFSNDYIKELFQLISKNKSFIVSDVKTTKEKVYPEKPFITSTLQKTAQRVLGLPVKKTMDAAQKLFESGHITYMRTDCTFIAEEFQQKLKSKIDEDYGTEYFNIPNQKKVKGAQEAHEAIRNTSMEKPENLEGVEKRLYDLIYERTITSHMKPAIYNAETIKLINETINDYGYFTNKIKSLHFLGFKIFKNNETITDEDEVIKVNKNDTFKLISCESIEKSDNNPQYYDEGSLVDLLEKTGIGRPSTYSSIISTLDNRNYTIIEDIIEKDKEVIKLVLTPDNQIKESNYVQKGGKMKGKIQLTDLGIQVLEYLRKNFMNIINKDFTLNVEEDLDKIANGKLNYIDVIRKVYDSFNDIVERQLIKSTKNMKYLGSVKEREIYLADGPYGPYLNIQYREQSKNVSLSSYLKKSNLDKDKITLKEAIILLKNK